MSRHRLVIWFKGVPDGSAVAAALQRAAARIGGLASVAIGRELVPATSEACTARIASFAKHEFYGELRWTIEASGKISGKLTWPISGRGIGNLDSVLTYKPRRAASGYPFESAVAICEFALALSSCCAVEGFVVEPTPLPDTLHRLREEAAKSTLLPGAEWIFGLNAKLVSAALTEALSRFEVDARDVARVWILSEEPLDPSTEAGMAALREAQAALAANGLAPALALEASW